MLEKFLNPLFVSGRLPRVVSIHTPSNKKVAFDRHILNLAVMPCYFLPVSRANWEGFKARSPKAQGEVFFNPVRVEKYSQPSTLNSQPSTMPRSFVAVMNIPSPYRLHLFNVMWRELERRGIGFHVHFMAKGHRDRPKSWLDPKIDFPHTYWRDWGFGEYHFNPGLVWKMLWNPPDYMVCGSSFDTFTGILIQLFSRTKVKMCWLEGNTKTPGRLTGPIGWFKRLIMGQCAYAPVPGSDAAKYIGLHQALTKRKMPMPVYLPNLVDETLFKTRGQCDSAKVDELRKNVGCNSEVKLCFIPARFVWDKGLEEFFSTIDPLMVVGWKILVLGHGPLQAAVEEVVASQGLSDNVIIKNSVPYEEVPLYYAAADMFLLPSVHDQNPLCVVEALHSGLPIALSDRAGNVNEAVTEGQNGWVLPVMDKEAFKAKLAEVFSSSKEKLAAMGRVSKRVNARFWDSEQAVKKFLDSTIDAFGCSAMS